MPIDFLDHVRAESARFGAVLAAADPSAPVPTCPGWDAADLLWHLAEVQGFWASVVRDRVTDPESVEEPERPSDYRALLAGYRRANEALIHRLDAELTTGSVTGFDPALATDGVAEVLECMYSGAPEWATHEIDGPVGRLATTDTGAEWFVQLGRFSGKSPNSGKTYVDRPTLTLAAGGDPSFTVTATARDLDAWLWNRPTDAPVNADGADVDRFRAIIASGVQ
jgi:hypothetical protein